VQIHAGRKAGRRPNPTAPARDQHYLSIQPHHRAGPYIINRCAIIRRPALLLVRGLEPFPGECAPRCALGATFS
jgi:hypothetical protein